MDNSKVIFKGLSRIQANVLALSAEDGRLQKFLNDLSVQMEVRDIEPFTDAEVDFDTDQSIVFHEVEFNNQ